MLDVVLLLAVVFGPAAVALVLAPALACPVRQPTDRQHRVPR